MDRLEKIEKALNCMFDVLWDDACKTAKPLSYNPLEATAQIVAWHEAFHELKAYRKELEGEDMRKQLKDRMVEILDAKSDLLSGGVFSDYLKAVGENIDTNGHIEVYFTGNNQQDADYLAQAAINIIKGIGK